MERESFICYKSFVDAWMQLDDKNRLKFFDRMLKYAIYWVDEITTGFAETMFILVRPNLDSNNKRFIDWCKWWRPLITSGSWKLITSGSWKNKPNVEVEVEVDDDDDVEVDKKKVDKKSLFLEKVFLTEKEYTGLVFDFWEKIVKDKIEDLDEYIINKCKWKDPYSDHNLTIRKRLKKDWILKKEHKEIIPAAETDDFFTSIQKQIWVE